MGRTSNAKTKLLETAIDAIWTDSYSSVTVDEICSNAGVKKGSFYHYFKSKEDLALQAIDSSWDNFKPFMDECFSPEHAPLERLRKHLESVIGIQKHFFEKKGKIMGCPYSTIGSEQSCNDNSGLREKAATYLNKIRTYTGNAIQEAYSLGQIDTSVDVEFLIAIYNNYYVGAMTQARVKNDVSALEHLVSECMYILRTKN